jgi:hypothetical protein
MVFARLTLLRLIGAPSPPCPVVSALVTPSFSPALAKRFSPDLAVLRHFPPHMRRCGKGDASLARVMEHSTFEPGKAN